MSNFDKLSYKSLKIGLIIINMASRFLEGMVDAPTLLLGERRIMLCGKKLNEYIKINPETAKGYVYGLTLGAITTGSCIGGTIGLLINYYASK